MTSQAPGLPVNNPRLKEVYLIVRPEEKYDLETALQSVMAPIYSTMQGTGRSGGGSLSCSAGGGKSPLAWRPGPHGAPFRPKTLFYFVIPETYVDRVIRVAGEVIRAKGGPEDCGLGIAIVSEVEAEMTIGPPSAEGRVA